MRNWVKFLLLATFAILVIPVAYIWFVAEYEFVQRYPTGVGSFNNIQYYRFDPDTSLEPSEYGLQTLFELQSDFTQNPVSDAPILWTEENYDEIVKKVSLFAWHESLDQWYLYRMIFRTDCSDDPKGFYWAEYIFFKESAVAGKKDYSARAIFIRPEYGDIAIGSDTDFPRPFWGWKYIRANSIKVTAEKALQLSEERGGKQARLAMNNQCSVYVSMNPDGYDFKGWNVDYSGNGNPADVEIFIHP
jgi:hypothetical protein